MSKRVGWCRLGILQEPGSFYKLEEASGTMSRTRPVYRKVRHFSRASSVIKGAGNHWDMDESRAESSGTVGNNAGKPGGRGMIEKRLKTPNAGR